MSATATARISGICRRCGCTDTAPCALIVNRGEVSLLDGEPTMLAYSECEWVDLDRTLCTNPRCVAHVELDELLSMLGLA